MGRFDSDDSMNNYDFVTGWMIVGIPLAIALLAVLVFTGCPKNPDGSVDWNQSYANYKEAQRQRCIAQLAAHEVAVTSGMYEKERAELVKNQGEETTARIEAALAASRAVCRIRLGRAEREIELEELQ